MAGGTGRAGRGTGAARGQPAAPASAGPADAGAGVTPAEVLRIIRILRRIREPFDAGLPVAAADAGWNVTLFLMEARLRGKPVNISTLVAVSGLPYGTAMRRLRGMIDAGHLVRVPKGADRKTFHLEPSRAYQDAFLRYAERIKALMAETFGLLADRDPDEFYFGGGDFAADILAPAPLRARLAGVGAELRFLLNDDNYFVAMRNLWSDYRNNLASPRSFRLEPLQALYAALHEELRRPVPGFEVVALNLPWIGEFAEAGLLQPLDGFITRENLNPFDFLPAVWSTGTWNERQYGIPIYCTVEVLAARRDLFAERNVPFPRSFDEVVAAARAFHDPARGFHGIAWNGAAGMPVASTFMILMGCCGAPIFTMPRFRRYYPWGSMPAEHLRPNVDSPEGRMVLDYLHRLVEVSPPDILEMDWNRRIRAFMTGEVAMCYCWSMRAARFEFDFGSVVKRKVAYLPQPKGPTGLSANPIGGFLLAVPANVPRERAELAFQSIAWMASPESMKKHVTSGLPVAPRFSVAADPEAAASSPIVRFLDGLAQRGMLCTWQRPPLPEYSAVEAALGHHIHAALSGAASDTRALAAAQQAIDRIMRERGRY